VNRYLDCLPRDVHGRVRSSRSEPSTSRRYLPVGSHPCSDPHIIAGSRRPVPEFARLVTATAAVGSRATRSGFGLPDTRCTLGSRSTCALGEAPVERGHSASHATGGGGAQEGPEYERGVKGPGEEPQDWLPAAVSRRRRTPSPYLASSASSASGWISILH